MVALGRVMKLHKFAILGAALFVGACSTAEMAWQRTDGRQLHAGHFRHAMHVCREHAWVGYEPSTQRMKQCMARKGYVWAEVTSYYGGYY